MSMISRFTTVAALLVSTATLWAQPSARGPGNADNNGGTSVTTPQRPSPPSSQPARDMGASTGTRTAPNPNGGLNTETGSIPELFSRNRNQSGQTGQSRQQGRNGGSDAQREFVANAFKFDSNDDRQLAANELSSLFLVLASSLQQERFGDDYGFNGNPGGHPQKRNFNRRPVPQNRFNFLPRRTSARNSTVRSSASNGTRVVPAQQTFIQRQSVREALLIFLQLALQFDTNGDGLLSQTELLALAASLLQNDFSLVQAVVQPTYGRTVSTNVNRQGRQNTTIGTRVIPRNNNLSSVKRSGGRSYSGRGGDPDRGMGRDEPNKPRPGNRPPDNRPPGNNQTGGNGAGQNPPNSGSSGNPGAGDRQGRDAPSPR